MCYKLKWKTEQPDIMDVKQGLVKFEDEGGCAEEVDMSGLDIAAILCPMCSWREDNREGNDSAKALEIAWARVLSFGGWVVWDGGKSGELAGGCGVELLLELEDALNSKDIVNRPVVVHRLHCVT